MLLYINGMISCKDCVDVDGDGLQFATVFFIIAVGGALCLFHLQKAVALTLQIIEVRNWDIPI